MSAQPKPKRKPKPKSGPQCNCIKQVDEQLFAKNMALDKLFAMNMLTRELTTNIRIAASKIDTSKRGKVLDIVPSYCPFCGKKYLQ